MIQQIIRFSIRNKFIIGLGTLALIGFGIRAMLKLPVDAVPDITTNQVQVITTAPSLSTEDIEQFVTQPVEISLSNLPGVEEIRSVSRFGLSVITIVFEEELGTYLPRQLIVENLNEIREGIPESFGKPFIGPITTGLGEIYQYQLRVDSGYMAAEPTVGNPAKSNPFEPPYSLTDLRTIQDWIVKRQMAMVPGVVEVNSLGGYVKQYEVAADPARLQSAGITLLDIYHTLQANNQNAGGAYLEKNHQANFIRGEGLARSIEDIQRMVIKVQRGVPVLIGDVAEVNYGHAVRYGAFTANGEEAVGGLVMMLKDENSNEVVEAVKERMKRIEQNLPEGIHIYAYHDRAELISKTTGTIQSNLLEGGLIVIFVLVLLLGNWRGGLIVASTIPLSLLAAFILMDAFGVWANLMSLGAIDFGIIVDGAVIIVESTVFAVAIRLRKKGLPDQKEMDEITLKSSSKMMNSAFFGQLIILIVFIPILTLEGVEGKMFRPMALTFGFAIIGAMVLCLTYVPMMSALLLRGGGTAKITWGDRFIQWLQKGVSRALAKAIVWRKGVIAGAFGCFILSAFLFTRLGGEFIPQLDEGDLAIQVLLKPGSSLQESVDATSRIERLLLAEFPEVANVYARIGVSEIPTDPMPMDIADVYLELKEPADWTSGRTKEQLIRKLEERLAQLPGVAFEFSQPIALRFNELLTGVRQDVAIKLFGPDGNLLNQKSNEIAEIIASVPGVADLRIEAVGGLPMMVAQYDRMLLARYGVPVEMINQTISSAFAGGHAGVIYEGEKRFDLVVRLPDALRQNLEDVKNLLIPLPDGGTIPLKEIATVQYKPGPMQISRENTSRRTFVGINVRGRDLESTVEEIRQKLDAQLELPPGYYLEYGGSFENLERATQRLQVVVPIALALIFILIFMALGSIRHSLMIYISIPLAAIGGVMALWLRGMPFSISAGVGFVVLFGVAVLNGLVLIHSFYELKKEKEMDLKDRVLKGTVRRVRPILLTASTDILGFLPMALSTSAGGEVQQPLATVVIGGLFTSTLLTLFILPVLYHWNEQLKRKNKIFIAKRALLIIIPGLCLVPAITFAQTPPQTIWTLEQAVEAAKGYYPEAKRATLQVAQQKALQKTAVNLGNTQVYTAGEEVPVNSDAEGSGVVTFIGLSQTNIGLLGISSAAKYQKATVREAESLQQLTLRQLERKVKMAWYEALAALEARFLAAQQDSLFKGFEKAAAMRYETEETSKLEYLAAQNKVRQIAAKRTLAEAEYQGALANLKKFLPPTSTIKVPRLPPGEYPVADTTSWQEHPLLNLKKNEQASAAAALANTRAGLLPAFNLNAGAQEINGTGGFWQYQAGLTLPLWFRPQQGRIQAASLQQNIKEQEAQQAALLLAAERVQAKVQYEAQKEVLSYYVEEAIPLAEAQKKAAALAFKEGEITYVAYLQALDQVMQIQQEYITYLKNFLVQLTELEYLN